MDIIPSTAPKSLTSDTTFSNYLLIVDSYSKVTKRYGTEKITTEAVMDNMYMVIFFYISFISPKNVCFPCALCGKVTKIFALDLKYTVQTLCGINKLLSYTLL